MKLRAAAVAVLAIAFALRPFSVRADGAFPDGMGVLLPADQPDLIVVATNFGLLVSEDRGATWGWICEEAIGMLASLYQLGAPPNNVLLSVTLDGLKYSTDFGCTWSRSGGEILGAFVQDAFPDPIDPLHAYALARRGALQSVHESRDADRTFGSPLFSGSANQYLSGIENARSSPEKIYVTLYIASGLVHPYLARSDDSGASWQIFDHRPTIDRHTIRLLAVDPVDAQKLYLLLNDQLTGRDRLAISTDEGRTVNIIYDPPGRLGAFFRRSDGALIIATTSGRALISLDGGASFTNWPNAPHVRALGERNGILYAVADNFVDGYAVARSFDQGATWQGLFRFEQLVGPKDCGNLATICAAPWQRLRSTLQLDGGTPSTDTDASVPDADAGNNPPPNNRSRGGCTEVESREGFSFSVTLVVLAMLASGLLAIRRRPPS